MADDFGLTMEQGIAKVLKAIIDSQCRVPVASKVEVKTAKCKVKDKCITLNTLPSREVSLMQGFHKCRLKELETKRKWRRKAEQYKQQRQRARDEGMKILGGSTRRRITEGRKTTVLCRTVSYKAKPIRKGLLVQKLPGWVEEFLVLHHPELIGRPFPGIGVFEDVFTQADLIALQKHIQAKTESLEADGSLLDMEEKWELHDL